eukprot:4516030-Amphidinium_carterae.3
MMPQLPVWLKAKRICQCYAQNSPPTVFFCKRWDTPKGESKDKGESGGGRGFPPDPVQALLTHLHGKHIVNISYDRDTHCGYRCIALPTSTDALNLRRN